MCVYIHAHLQGYYANKFNSNFIDNFLTFARFFLSFWCRCNFALDLNHIIGAINDNYKFDL